MYLQCQNKLSETTKIVQPMGPYQSGGNPNKRRKQTKNKEGMVQREKQVNKFIQFWISAFFFACTQNL